MVAIYITDKMDPPWEESCLHIWRQQQQGLEWTSCLLFSLSRVPEPLLWGDTGWSCLTPATCSADRLWCPPSTALCWDQLPPGLTPLLSQGLPSISYGDHFLKTHTANCLHISPCSEEETHLISMNTFMNIWKKVCPSKNMSISVFFHWIFLMKLCFKLTWRKLCTSWETIEKIRCRYYTLADINPKQGIHLFREREWIFFL